MTTLASKAKSSLSWLNQPSPAGSTSPAKDKAPRSLFLQTASRPQSNLGLHHGAATGNLGLVKFALDHGVSVDSSVGGVLPIHAASCYPGEGNLIVLQYLIDRGADVNAPRTSRKHGNNDWSTIGSVGVTGSTALHFAAANGCTKTVELLLRNGARPDVKDKLGNTPLVIALAKHHFEIARLLREHAPLEEKPSNPLDSLIEQRRPIYTRRPSMPSITEESFARRRPQSAKSPKRQSLNLPRVTFWSDPSHQMTPHGADDASLSKLATARSRSHSHSPPIDHPTDSRTRTASYPSLLRTSASSLRAHSSSPPALPATQSPSSPPPVEQPNTAAERDWKRLTYPWTPPLDASHTESSSGTNSSDERDPILSHELGIEGPSESLDAVYVGKKRGRSGSLLERVVDFLKVRK
ncbi:uncharacterized protein VTP21DRAFT_10144 [Calcarisporiella thermophila]|uniref:uncharacterized protein n=1 Tax=Calcarisporiella thermophila TaxID=911321 RepID=UPI0037426194